MVTQTRDGWLEFQFYRPAIGHVTLAGDFNGWNRSSLPMARGDDGWWRYRIRLAPGFYQFRYFGDGQWYTDYAAFGIEHSPLGLNSVLKVDPPLAADETLLCPARPTDALPCHEDQDDAFDLAPATQPAENDLEAQWDPELDAVPA